LQTYGGLTALMIASVCSKKGSSIETFKLLIDSGANLHIMDSFGDTFLSYLVRFSESLDIIKYIPKMDITINFMVNNVTKIPIEKMNNSKYKSYNGNTLLHWCTIGIKEKTSTYEILEYLESLDIDKTLKNGEGKTYLDYLIVSYYVSTKCEICHIDGNIVMAILNCSCNCGRQCVNCAYRLTKCCYCRTEFEGFKIIRIV
jgi:ankyrin repeat protein